jgi:pilus assembly protein FimV
MLLAGGGVAVALLAGGLMFLRSRRRVDTGETSFLESRLQPDSFFGASGGQRVDTRDATGGPSSMSYSLSQLDAIGDVDPVAEADVYLAYGRDLQAEEILKEALRSTPERLAIRTKLLEVYAKRRDTKGFEQLAIQLHGLTQGQGEDWAKVQELGLSIDADHPLYQPGGQPPAAPAGSDALGESLGASTIPHSVIPAPSALDSVAPPAADVPSELGEGLDLDIDISAPMPLDEPAKQVSPAQAPLDEAVSLDLPEFGEDLPAVGGQAADVAQPLPALDFGVDAAPTPAAAVAPAGQAEQDVSLDFNLDAAPDFPAQVPAAAAAPAALPLDLDGISLDLDAAPAGGDLSHAEAGDAGSDPMARKLELADEFRQIGDADGARELLQEVIDLAQDDALRNKARGMLDSLG